MNIVGGNSGKRRAIVRLGVLGVALSSAGFCSMAQAADSDGWSWLVAPYVWGVSFNTDLERTEPPAGGISNDTNFDGVLDKFDGAFEIHVEGQGDHFGVLSDFTYLGLADNHDYTRFHTESDLDARLFELAAVWSPGDDRYNGWEVIAGLRYIDVDLNVDFQPVNPLFATTSYKSGESFYDFMIGGRYTWAISDRWSATLRADTSFGDTDGTWNASAFASYKTGSGAWLFGYRYIDAKTTSGDNDINMVADGPVIGYGFTF